MKNNSVTLNISHNTMKDNQWNILDSIYKISRGWVGYSSDSIPYWFSMNEDIEHINASAEMHGLIFDSFMEEEKWNIWVEEFISLASDKLGFRVVDLEKEYCPIVNKRIEEKLFKAILSYRDFDKQYDENLHRFMDVIMELNINGVAKEILVDILTQMLGKLNDEQFMLDVIIGEVLDYMTAWATLVENTKIYEFFVHFNPERMNVSEE